MKSEGRNETIFIFVLMIIVIYISYKVLKNKLRQIIKIIDNIEKKTLNKKTN